MNLAEFIIKKFTEVAFHSETSDLPIDMKWKIINGNTRIGALIPIVKTS